MADPITTSSVDDLIYTAIINDRIIDYARAAVVCPQLCRQADLSLEAGKAYSFPKWSSLTAAAIAEGDDMADTALTTDTVTVTASEVGVMVTVKDLAAESDIVNGLEDYARQLGLAVADKIDSDICALFPAFAGGTAVGTSGADLTDDTFLEALYTLEAANGPKPYAAVLHPVQVHDLRSDIITNGGTFYGPAVGATLAGAQNIVDHGNGYVGSLFGVDIFQTTNVPLANADADRAGAIFAKGEALGLVTKWPVRTELQRDASARATEIVVTSCYGVGELMDSFGVPIVTDA